MMHTIEKYRIIQIPLFIATDSLVLLCCELAILYVL